MKWSLIMLLFICFCYHADGQLVAKPATAINSKLKPNEPLGKLMPFEKTLPKEIPVLSKDFYATHLPFFCKQELKLQKINMPVIFRMGSVEDCNYLEKKTSYR